ncbi:MAG TPA: sporulation peptidase YabG [Bacillota bacterium]|nr:sporulation peptidase YabG [Bacillota bacterium]
MGKFAAGDLVSRKSYDDDVVFKVIKTFVNGSGIEMAELKGLDIRLAADAPLTDLKKLGEEQLQLYREHYLKRHCPQLARCFNSRQRVVGESPDFFALPGRVLHLDGDPEYMKLCLAAYSKLKLQAWGYAVPEQKQPTVVLELLRIHLPDILVLTGHDGLIRSKGNLSDLKNYHNSSYFVEGVKKARQFELGTDSLFIFAGACQSYYEALIEARANYASSPQRVMIHALDPVVVVEKIAFTPYMETVNVPELVSNTITGPEGIGGIESQGKHRNGWPKTS